MGICGTECRGGCVNRLSRFLGSIYIDGVGDLRGLNKRGNLSLNLCGVGEATGVGVGVGDTSTDFFRVRFGVGEAAAGDSGVETEALLSTSGVGSGVFRV